MSDHPEEPPEENGTHEEPEEYAPLSEEEEAGHIEAPGETGEGEEGEYVYEEEEEGHAESEEEAGYAEEVNEGEEAEVEPGESVTAPAEEEPSLLQPCTNCAALLDVGDLEPFAKVHCPMCGTAIRARTQLKNFTLVEVLGAGGMGAVYKALDTNLDRMVALKVVRKEYSADAEYLAKFEREARITASVNHPHVVKVYSFGSDHGLFYIAMELVDKGSLDDLMNLQGRVAEIQALTVGIQMAQGLSAAHQKGLIHRDVKPGNILFADAQTAKIVDFGLALLAEHEAEERGEVWGTPYYVAPEKLDHQPEDFRSDMYSLGGTLFHAISGRPPFEADTASMVALKHLKSKAVSLQAFAPDVSSATAYVINRMLHKEPDQRYQSYAELVEHLEYAKNQLVAEGTGPRKPKARVVVEGAGQQKLAGIITLILLVLMLGAGAAFYFFHDKIFRHQDAAAAVVTGDDDGDTAAKRMHTEFDAARQKIESGDYKGALVALDKLNDEPELTQPLQNWVTVHEGLASLLLEKEGDEREWFKVVQNRSHYSSEASDSALVNFFSKVGGIMAGRNGVTPSVGGTYSLDSVEALAPFLFALKDWNLGQFEDAGRLLGLYLTATPKEPFDWVAEYKPLAQQYADNEAAYEKINGAMAAADTPAKRADVLRAIAELRGKVKGTLAARLAQMQKDYQKRSAKQDASYNQHVTAQAEQDKEALANAKRQYTALCADFRFSDALAAVQGTVVNTPEGVKTRDVMLKKAGWLCDFKTQLIKDINAYGYAVPAGVCRMESRRRTRMGWRCKRNLAPCLSPGIRSRRARCSRWPPATRRRPRARRLN
jgi:hypothetical protein